MSVSRSVARSPHVASCCCFCSSRLALACSLTHSQRSNAERPLKAGGRAGAHVLIVNGISSFSEDGRRADGGLWKPDHVCMRVVPQSGDQGSAWLAVGTDRRNEAVRRRHQYVHQRHKKEANTTCNRQAPDVNNNSSNSTSSSFREKHT